MKRPLRITPIPRKEPDLKLLAQALITLADEQRQKRQTEQGRQSEKPREARHA